MDASLDPWELRRRGSVSFLSSSLSQWSRYIDTRKGTIHLRSDRLKMHSCSLSPGVFNASPMFRFIFPFLLPRENSWQRERNRIAAQSFFSFFLSFFFFSFRRYLSLTRYLFLSFFVFASHFLPPPLRYLIFPPLLPLFRIVIRESVRAGVYNYFA